MERIRTKQEQREEADRILQEYLEIVQNDFEIQISAEEDTLGKTRDKIVSDTEQTKVGSYPILSDAFLTQYTAELQNGIEALVFAREIEKLQSSNSRQDFTGEQTSDFTQGVRNALNIFDFQEPGDEEEHFLTLYHQLQRAIEGDSASNDLEAVSETLPATPDHFSMQQLSSLHHQFMRKYYPSETWVKFAQDEYIKYKNKIVELVQSQISIGGVQNDIFDTLERERGRIREQLAAQEAYLVCSKRIADYDGKSFQYDLLPEKYPRSIRIGNKYLAEPGKEEESLEIKMRVVFPRKSYGHSENFIDQSLSDVTPDEELVYVSKLSIPFEHGRSETEFYEVADNENDVNYVLSKADFLLRGRSEEEITRAAIDNLRMAEMDVAEILKSLTLRSIVSGVTHEEEQFFSKKKEEIEEGFDIHSVFEWGEQDPEIIAELLHRWDEDNVSNRWDWVAREYINEIKIATPPSHIDEQFDI